jgi:prepilin-type N-terminal cleavage/methylation domain-containing protein
MRTRLTKTRRGVTLTELLVVLAIIGLLSTIAIPVYLTRMEGARIRTAQAELQEIANAEEICALYHGFYVPLQLLDNVAEEDNVGRTTNPPADAFWNETPGNIYLVDPYRRATAQAGSGQWRLSDTNIQRVADLRNAWQGPFLNAQRVYLPPDITRAYTSEQVRRDFPLDPWGQPYRFFSPIGPIGQNWYQTDPVAQNNDGFSDGRILNDSSNDPFDRYAIVSFGPNGALDDPFDQFGDDITYQFGMVFSTSHFYRYYRTH